jgi:phage shock protein E
MDWIIIVVTLVLLVAYIFLRRRDLISADAAVAYLKHAAILIDVRSPAEFSRGHLKGAINMPLPQIESLIGTQVKDKEQVLLLHCQTGMRSGIARKKLAALGYTRAYNLGSYDHASRVVDRV